MSRILDARILVGRETGLAYPSGILYDGQNRNLWIVDMGNRRLVCFDQIRHGFQSFDTSPVFRRPLAITRLDGRLVVSDALDNTIWIRQTDKTWDSLVSPDELTPPLDFPEASPPTNGETCISRISITTGFAAETVRGDLPYWTGFPAGSRMG